MLYAADGRCCGEEELYFHLLECLLNRRGFDPYQVGIVLSKRKLANLQMLSADTGPRAINCVAHGSHPMTKLRLVQVRANVVTRALPPAAARYYM